MCRIESQTHYSDAFHQKYNYIDVGGFFFFGSLILFEFRLIALKSRHFKEDISKRKHTINIDSFEIPGSFVLLLGDLSLKIETIYFDFLG